ncbi:helix-turn-helix domain-containing protein [Evansella sp. AB-rgal1]|uniref:helix-turn-helix domain-containing protein n=1 Tax=Evansella sp. AB-rgal1 TaxID=3242696 RepID=UPI00359D06BE
MGKILLSDSQHYRSFGFRFKGSQQERVAGIYSIGLEKQESTSYDWDGLTRNEFGKIVFQYTLRGTGEITLGDQTHPLQSGDAFFVKLPSAHRYYLPQHSQGWEFVYITLFGEEAHHIYESITKEVGSIIKVDPNSTPIKLLFSIYEKASGNELQDAFATSNLAYSFLMELNRFIFHLEKKEQGYPKSVVNAVTFMNNNYEKPISLDDIVAASGISKYHFTRTFQEATNSTPMQYVTKLRLNKAVNLLKKEELSVEEVAVRVGYSNGNYFTKVFRTHLGISPGKYRSSKSFVPVDHLIL